jgi:hypothetical protein
MVRKTGLEPVHPMGATPSRWCVCQFRHFRVFWERENTMFSRIYKTKNFVVAIYFCHEIYNKFQIQELGNCISIDKLLPIANLGGVPAISIVEND